MAFDPTSPEAVALLAALHARGVHESIISAVHPVLVRLGVIPATLDTVTVEDLVGVNQFTARGLVSTIARAGKSYLSPGGGGGCCIL
jgi:hypothetical protein